MFLSHIDVSLLFSLPLFLIKNISLVRIKKIIFLKKERKRYGSFIPWGSVSHSVSQN